MIPFRDPQLTDRAWVEELFAASGSRGCEYSFVTLYIWSQTYCQQIARMGDYVLERLRGSIGGAYLFPAGRGPLEPVLAALEADAAERGEPCRFVCMAEEQAAELEKLRPGGYQIEPDRDGWDYLYGIDRMADLPGKKLHAKRNHIRRFEDACPDWSAEVMDEDNLVECAEMDLEWNRRYRPDKEKAEQEERTLLNERHALSVALRDFHKLGLTGLLIRAEGKVVAFTIGSRIGEDTFDLHFEKAFSETQGAYPLIYREFARWLRQHIPGLRWLNREDDMGMEGLRKSKASYYPDRMVEKFTAIQRPV